MNSDTRDKVDEEDFIEPYLWISSESQMRNSWCKVLSKQFGLAQREVGILSLDSRREVVNFCYNRSIFITYGHPLRLWYQPK